MSAIGARCKLTWPIEGTALVSPAARVHANSECVKRFRRFTCRAASSMLHPKSCSMAALMADTGQLHPGSFSFPSSSCRSHTVALHFAVHAQRVS